MNEWGSVVPLPGAAKGVVLVCHHEFSMIMCFFPAIFTAWVQAQSREEADLIRCVFTMPL